MRRGVDLFRTKGVLAVKGMEEKFVFQAVVRGLGYRVHKGFGVEYGLDTVRALGKRMRDWGERSLKHDLGIV